MSKITKRFVDSIIPDPEKATIFWDDELKGFGVVVRPSGRQTYCVQYRNKNRVLRRLKLGIHGQITTEEARVLAKQHLGAVSHEEDPLETKKAIVHLPSISDLAHDYVERYGKNKRPRSLKEDQKLLQNHIIPMLGEKKVAHLSRRDIETFHARLKQTPYQANRALALLSKMLSLAVAWDWREISQLETKAKKCLFTLRLALKLSVTTVLQLLAITHEKSCAWFNSQN